MNSPTKYPIRAYPLLGGKVFGTAFATCAFLFPVARGPSAHRPVARPIGPAHRPGPWPVHYFVHHPLGGHALIPVLRVGFAPYTTPGGGFCSNY